MKPGDVDKNQESPGRRLIIMVLHILQQMHHNLNKRAGCITVPSQYKYCC